MKEASKTHSLVGVLVLKSTLAIYQTENIVDGHPAQRLQRTDSRAAL